MYGLPPSKSPSHAHVSQVIYGDVDAFLHHMKGLDDLVAMRGGLDKFENPEVVMRCLPWCDHYRALFTNTAPKYEVQPSPYVLEFGTQEPGFRRDMFLSAQMPTIVDGIRQLTQLKLESHQRDVSPVELEHFLAQRDFLEHQLVTLHTQLLHSATWDSCVILGLILFEHLELRLMNSKYATMGHIALLLRNALLATELDTCWGSEGYPVLIWVLFMGASISEDFEDLRSWFVCTLRDVMTSTGCNSWESVNYVLQSFVWANGACDMTSIWLEVMT